MLILRQPFFNYIISLERSNITLTFFCLIYQFAKTFWYNSY
ncbi:hypothetical protein AKH91_15405, partial [Listeria monocytogenes]|nr:hypothetical protein [Listeria monocytogenes]